MSVCFAHFLRESLSTQCRAATIVGKCSFFSRALAVFLSAALGWPGSWYFVSTKELDSNTTQAFNRISPVGCSTPFFKLGPNPQRHHSPVGGVLDDDPAILDNDSEDWMEGCSRSEERRVGGECRSRWWPYPL